MSIAPMLLTLASRSGSGSGGGEEPPPTDDRLNFYIISGQSNCGRSQVNEMTGPEAALYPGLISNAFIYNGPYEQLNVGGNTALANNVSADEFGPEASLFKSFADADNVDRYIFKYGVGNSGLQSHWVPGQTLNTNLKTFLDNAIASAVTAGIKFNLKAFIWMQGENDATDATWANNYEDNLVNFFDDFTSWWQTRLISNGWGTFEDFVTIIGRINGISDPLETERATVRAKQAAFCGNGINNAILIDTDSYPLRDTVHYSATGQIQFGIDIYNALTI